MRPMQSQDYSQVINYATSVEKITDQKMKTALLTLNDMGFSDFEKNKAACMKHQSDLNLVMNELQ